MSFWAPLVVITLSAAVLGLVISQRRGQLCELKLREALLQARLASLRDRNADLRRERDQLLSDAAAIERVAREQYGFAGPGEVDIPFSPSPRGVAAVSPAVRSLDRWDRVLGRGEFPWRLPLIVCLASAVVLGTLDVISASRRAH